MNIPLFNIGLSVVSSNNSAEARRILSLLAGRSVTDKDINKGENGRPYFCDNLSADFNISHSKDMVAVSLVKGGADGRKYSTGVDIQFVKKRVNTIRIAEKFFSDLEINYIQNDEICFFQIWALKESYIKLYGLSVFDMAKVPSFIHRDGRGRLSYAFGAAVTAPLSFYLYELQGENNERYFLAAALEGAGGAKLKPAIKWFSQSLLPCRSIAEIKAAPNPADTVSPKM